MVQFNGKKGLEMSVNIIVMLVIGLTILGLVISFVTNFLGSAEDQFVGSLSDDDRTKLEQVERQSGNFAFLSGTLNVQKESDQRAKLYMKVRNPTDQEFYFGGGEVLNSDDLTVSFSRGSGSTGGGGDEPTIFAPSISLENGEVGAYPLEVVAGSNVDPGVYYAEFTATIGSGGNPTEYKEVVTIEVE